MKTHKDCSSFRLANEVEITPVKLLELKFLLVIMKEGRAIAIIWKITCNFNKIIPMQLVDTHHQGHYVFECQNENTLFKYQKAWQNFFFLLDCIWKEDVPLSNFL